MAVTDYRITRRAVLESGAATCLVLASGLPAGAAVTGGPMTAGPVAPPIPRTPMRFRINATEHALELDPRTTLLDALRNHLGLTGSKKRL
ncbi:hypothetical protein NGR_b01360 (plasmid) [Sinorhizobium fredii NGR234]|uniref:Uncharacterized protein n=1 Tax=Sinorhizobium fredii (strain NBRC 101917 / NGR234) TaxID=394 RepID=C3KN29_SINFN|nr:hypothetical protein NGR_b01360 [Sinorhizobium fredii NGR234]